MNQIGPFASVGGSGGDGGGGGWINVQNGDSEPQCAAGRGGKEAEGNGVVESLLAVDLRCKSRTKLLSFGSTSSVFVAWQVKMEFRSERWIAGHSNRFSMTSPELCSYCSSTSMPLMSHLTDGCGRPAKERKGKARYLDCCCTNTR